jgi:hypothetical protein
LQECCLLNNQRQCCPLDRPICCTNVCCPAGNSVCCLDALGNQLCCPSGSLCINFECQQYAFMNGGGDKYLLANGSVSTLRLSLGGLVDGGNPLTSFTSSTGLVGMLQAYNYASRLLISSVSFSSFSGTFDGIGNFTASGLGKATVNGVLKNISFTDGSVGGVSKFEVRNADTGAFLAGGTGEAGRSALSLSTSPV